MSKDQLTTLLVDDNAVDLKVLSAIIRKLGHNVIECSSANQALDQFTEHRPDIILLDVMMPEINGLTLAKRIRAIADRYIPIIFLSSLVDNDSLVECLEHGGDDLLSKPYNMQVIEAKIKAFVRMNEMRSQLPATQSTSKFQKEKYTHELNIAHAVFDNVSHAELLKTTNINHLLSSKAVFNGEIIFAAHKPSGDLQVFIGDVSTEGLPAALTSIPLAEIFYGMTEKGFSLKDILVEMNEKLHAILPVGIFCSTAMFEINYRKKTLEAWQGGMPTGYIVSADKKSVTPLASTHLPLAVLPQKQFSSETVIHPISDDDSVLFFTNSIFNLKDGANNLYNEASVKALFEQLSGEGDIYSRLEQALTVKNANLLAEHATLLEVSIANTTYKQLRRSIESISNSGPHDFSTQFTFKANTLKSYDPVPTCVNAIMDVPGLRSFHGQIYTILTELYINALDHGLLGLQSCDKTCESGFESYYSQRKARLEELEEGQITITFDHKMQGHEGVLQITVEDTGKGFDVKDMIAKNMLFSGRGLSIVESLSDNLTFNQAGNAVTSELKWQYE